MAVPTTLKPSNPIPIVPQLGLIVIRTVNKVLKQQSQIMVIQVLRQVIVLQSDLSTQKLIDLLRPDVNPTPETAHSLPVEEWDHCGRGVAQMDD